MTATRHADKPAINSCQERTFETPDNINPMPMKAKQLAVSGDMRPGKALAGVR